MKGKLIKIDGFKDSKQKDASIFAKELGDFFAKAEEEGVILGQSFCIFERIIGDEVYLEIAVAGEVNYYSIIGLLEHAKINIMGGYEPFLLDDSEDEDKK